MIVIVVVIVLIFAANLATVEAMVIVSVRALTDPLILGFSS